MKQLKKSRTALDRKHIRKFFKMTAPPSEKHKGREAMDWKGCPKCDRVKARHYAKGLCSVCYRRMKRRGEIMGGGSGESEEESI